MAILNKEDILKYTIIITSSVISGFIVKILINALNLDTNNIFHLGGLLTVFVFSVWITLNSINDLVSWWTKR